MSPRPAAHPRTAKSPSPFQARIERIRAGSLAEQPALKAERIQELLRSYPGWQSFGAGPGLVRGYRFASAADAAAFTAFVAGVLAGVDFTAKFEITGSLVALHVATLESAGAVSTLDFDVAALIEGREE